MVPTSGNNSPEATSSILSDHTHTPRDSRCILLPEGQQTLPMKMCEVQTWAPIDCWLYIYMTLCINIHIYIYIHSHLHTCIHIFIYIYLSYIIVTCWLLIFLPRIRKKALRSRGYGPWRLELEVLHGKWFTEPWTSSGAMVDREFRSMIAQGKYHW